MTIFAKALTDLATRSARPDWTLAAIAKPHCSWHRSVGSICVWMTVLRWT